MADFSKPVTTDAYANVLTYLKATTSDLALGLDPATTTPTNVPTNSVRWNSASNKWQKFNGTSWVDLAASYAINISGTAAGLSATLAIASGGTGATTAAAALVNMGERTGENGSTKLPTGTTAQRDGTPAAGYIRFNSDITKFEGYTGSAWASIADDAAVVTLTGNQTIAGTKTFSSSPVVPGLNGGQLAGMRNKVINGSIKVDQRNAGASQTFTAAAALAYCVDRFYGYCTGANITGQRIALSNGQNRYRFTGAASNTAVGFGHRIEAVNCLDLAGSTATFSVKLSSSSLTTITWTAYYANTADTFGTLASPTRTQIATGTFTINSTEATYSTNISVPSAATTGIEIVLTGGALLAAQTLTIGDLQLEAGSVATPFEHRPYGAELALCQRYLPAVNATGATQNFWSAYTQSANVFRVQIPFKVSARVSPTGVTVSSAGHFSVSYNGAGAVCTSIVLSNGGAESSSVDAAVASAAINLPGMLYSTNASASLLFTGCEL